MILRDFLQLVELEQCVKIYETSRKDGTAGSMMFCFDWEHDISWISEDMLNREVACVSASEDECCTLEICVWDC